MMISRLILHDDVWQHDSSQHSSEIKGVHHLLTTGPAMMGSPVRGTSPTLMISPGP